MRTETYNYILSELLRNEAIYKDLLTGLSEDAYMHVEAKGKWCLLEVICHLRDEEKEDFRARLKVILIDPSKGFVPINPPDWVTERNYIEQNFNEVFSDFLNERKASLKWLGELKRPDWESYYEHKHFGKMTAELFLSNWLAHDYIHIRQISRIKRSYFKSISHVELNYAGDL